MPYFYRDDITTADMAFDVTSHYDSAIFNYFNKNHEEAVLKISETKGEVLRYGENPHQKGFFFGDLDKINKAEVNKLLKEKKAEKAPKEELEICEKYLKLLDQDSKLNGELKLVSKDLETKVQAHYPKLTEAEIKTLVVEHKWMHTLETAITTEMDRVSQALAQRIKGLADRYATPITVILNEVKDLETKVNQHLAKMGFVWN